MLDRIERLGLQGNALILTICNALFICSISIDLSLTGIVGYQLAPQPWLATLPFAFITVGAALTTWGAAGLMQRLGRQMGFVIGTAFGALSGLISVWAVLQGMFWSFALGTFCVGIWQAFAQYYRLAAADNVPKAQKARAVSYVLAGGLIAALAGPSLANWSRRWLGDPFFAGAYLAVAGLAGVSLLLLSLYRDDAHLRNAAGSPPRRMVVSALLARPDYRAALVNSTVSGVVMMFLMTAAPIAAIGCGLSVGDSTSIIQWHLLGMYGPSLFAGMLISRIGLSRVLQLGNVITLACVIVAASSQSNVAFHASLLALGVGWNFMFVAGTALLTQSHSAEEQARAQGFAEFLRFGGTALGALLAGPLLEFVGWEAINWAVLPLLFAAFWATLSWKRQQLIPV